MAPREIRVTHVVFDLEGGGLESMVGALARQFSGGPVTMSVITLSGRRGRLGEAIWPLVDEFRTLKPIPKVSMLWPWGLARAIRRTRPQVVHLHSGSWYRGVTAARLAGVRRIVYTEHGLLQDVPRVEEWLRKRAARRTDVVVPVSESLREHLRRSDGVGDRQLQLIENGIDVDRFSPGEVPDGLRRQLDIPAHAKVVGSMGRLEAVKAYGDLIRAFASMRSATGGVPMYLVLCGDGKDRADLQRLADDLGVASVVRFPGWVDDQVAYYRLFDVFALTSLSEGMPMSLLEAMASGAVPVVTAVGSNGETVGAEMAQQIVGPGDVDGIAAAIARVLKHDGERDRLAVLARSTVTERFSAARMADRYEKVYAGANGRADVGSRH